MSPAFDIFIAPINRLMWITFFFSKMTRKDIPIILFMEKFHLYNISNQCITGQPQSNTFMVTVIGKLTSLEILFILIHFTV